MDGLTLFRVVLILLTVSRTVTAQAEHCGGILNATEVVANLTSPNYPAPYPPDSVCLWDIRAPPGHVVLLEVTFLDVEPYTDCQYDQLIVSEFDLQVTAKLCGQELPDPLQSTGNKFLLSFVTDRSGERAGFAINYRAIRRATTDVPMTTQVYRECGGQLPGLEGSFVSPSYPDLYPGDTFCLWEISAPKGTQVTLTFWEFDTEGDASCNRDTVEVLDTSAEATTLGKFCGRNLPPTLHSLGNKLTIVFTSDQLIFGTGFVASYSATGMPENPFATTTTLKTSSPTTTATTTKASAGPTDGMSTATPVGGGGTSGLPQGAMIGIGAGAAVLVLAAIIVTVVCIRQRRASSQQPHRLLDSKSDIGSANPYLGQPDGLGGDHDPAATAAPSAPPPSILRPKTGPATGPGRPLPSPRPTPTGHQDATTVPVDVATPWGAKRRSTMTEMSPEYGQGLVPAFSAHGHVAPTSRGPSIAGYEMPITHGLHPEYDYIDHL